MDFVEAINVGPIQILTALGVAVTILIGYSSLNQQRVAAARESLEQLDDLYIRKPESKLKPILHSYKRWPFNQSVIKLQSYLPSEYAGVSRIHTQFLLAPRSVFDGYDVETVNDGYLVELGTADPVQIRRSIQIILQRMSEVGNNSYEGFTWVFPKEQEEHYSYDAKDELLPAHKLILDFLPQRHGKNPGDIQGRLSDEGYPLDWFNRFSRT